SQMQKRQRISNQLVSRSPPPNSFDRVSFHDQVSSKHIKTEENQAITEEEVVKRDEVKEPAEPRNEDPHEVLGYGDWHVKIESEEEVKDNVSADRMKITKRREHPKQESRFKFKARTRAEREVKTPLRYT
ncbi:hypothetical protein Ciccas_014344, partial [Cichlidogyrus casuarinus]